MNKLITLRVLAVVEATSFLALLVATYFKHSDQGETGVSVLGPIHGVLFLAFCVSAILCAQEHSWPTRTTVWVLICGVVPFGGYFVDWHFRGQIA